MKVEQKVLLVSIGLAAGSWVSHAVVDYLFFYEGPFLQLLVLDVSTHEIYVRSIVAGAFLVFGGLLARVVAERRRAEEAARRERDKANTYLDLAGTMFLVVGADQTVTLINKKGCEVLGYAEEELLGKNWFDTCMPETVRAEMRPMFEQLMAGQAVPPEQHEFPVVTKSGEERIIAWHHTLVRDEKGSVTSCLCAGEDITERKQAENALRESELNYHEIFDAANDMIVVFDATTGEILDVNRKMCELIGYTADELKQLEVADFSLGEPPYTQKEALQWIRKAAKGEPQFLEWHCKAKDGRLFWVEANLKRIFLAGQERVLAVGSDITERKRAEEELRETQRRFRDFFENAPIGFHIFGSDRIILDANYAELAMIGYSRDEIIGKKTWADLIVPEQRGQFEQHWRDLTTKGKVRDLEYTLVHKDGRHINVIVNASARFDEQGNLVSTRGSTLNITERKRAEESRRESEEKYRQLVELMNEGLAVIDRSAVITFVNDAFCELAGYTRDELIGRSAMMLYNDYNRKVLSSQLASRHLGISEPYELTITRKDGTEVHTLVHPKLFHSRDGQVEGSLAVFTDITDRKRNEERMKASLREKETLLKELNHRVKNNLQVISSMLNLQSAYIRDPVVLAMFNECQGRIRSVALIHEQLYQSEDISRIDFRQYVKTLAGNLFHSYGTRFDDVSLKTHVTDARVDVDTAITCGLIINELVSNSLKYAFPAGRKGQIRIDFRSDHDREFELIIGDNGVGLPDEDDLQNKPTLGLQLVRILAKQLDGQLELDKSNGTEFRIMFPAPIHSGQERSVADERTTHTGS